MTVSPPDPRVANGAAVLARAFGALALTAGLATSPACSRDADLAAAREGLVQQVEADMATLLPASARRTLDPRVRAALARVPRHEFVPLLWRHLAYSDHPLPIGHGQTISQPFIVALMTDVAAPQPGDRVLEIGTGSGYQAAVLAELAREVYTIEIVPALGEEAAERLRELGYANVQVRVGDGYLGWPEAAPFNVIVVTAAPPRVPQPLLDQLAPGGRLVVPVGPSGGAQDLLLVQKEADGRTVTRTLLPVRFVPLVRERR